MWNINKRRKSTKTVNNTFHVLLLRMQNDWGNDSEWISKTFIYFRFTRRGANIFLTPALEFLSAWLKKILLIGNFFTFLAARKLFQKKQPCKRLQTGSRKSPSVTKMSSCRFTRRWRSRARASSSTARENRITSVGGTVGCRRPFSRLSDSHRRTARNSSSSTGGIARSKPAASATFSKRFVTAIDNSSILKDSNKYIP